jgi:hemerythrin
MPNVEWEDKYLLGIEQFDEHHKYLVGLLNEVYEMFVSGQNGDGEVMRILDSLAEYATYHFTLEENWMRKLDYPKREGHFLEHERFIRRLSEFNQHFRDGTANLTLEMVSFLRGWLLNHVLTIDAEYGAFIRKGPMCL